MKNTIKKLAKVVGDHNFKEVSKAIKLLRKAGYRVSSDIVSGCILEAICFEGSTVIGEFRHLDDLEKFLKAS